MFDRCILKLKRIKNNRNNEHAQFGIKVNNKNVKIMKSSCAKKQRKRTLPNNNREKYNGGIKATTKYQNSCQDIEIKLVVLCVWNVFTVLFSGHTS